jgi:hypothetical protein
MCNLLPYAVVCQLIAGTLVYSNDDVVPSRQVLLGSQAMQKQFHAAVSSQQGTLWDLFGVVSSTSKMNVFMHIATLVVVVAIGTLHHLTDKVLARLVSVACMVFTCGVCKFRAATATFLRPQFTGPYVLPFEGEDKNAQVRHCGPGYQRPWAQAALVRH